jgi:hypothetical protein
MDYLDTARVSDSSDSVLSRLYLSATVTFAVALVASLRKVRQDQSLPYPQNIIAFALLNGLIFRAVTWASLDDWDKERSHLLTSYDYARIFFFTASNLTIHLIPIVTAHRLLSYRNQSSFKSGLPGQAILISYLFTLVIFALNICCMGIGSTIPHDAEVMAALGSNSGGPSSLTTFLGLMDAANMLYWVFAVAYVVLLIEFYSVFRWSYLVFCLLMIATQIVLTIVSFLPPVPNALEVKIILQYVFVLQISFTSLMLATATGYQWLPPPLDYFDEEELQEVPKPTTH